MSDSVFSKMFGHKKSTPKEELERTLSKLSKKPEERKEHIPVIPPTLKKVGAKAWGKFKEASIRMAEEELKNKPKTASKGIFEAFKEASIRAYEEHGTPGVSEIMSPATIKRMTPKHTITSKYKKQRKQKTYYPWI